MAAVLAKWGAPATPTNIDTMLRWANNESGGYNPNSAGGKFNPLNVVTQSGDNHTGQGGSQGDIADFGTFADGVNATARLFAGNRNAAGIIDALKANNQPGAFSAINRFYSTWGGAPLSFGQAPNDTAAPGVADGGGPGPDTSAAGLAKVAADDECLWTLPKVLGIGGQCLIKKSAGRALVGAAAITGGAFVMLIGAALIAAGTRPGRAALGAATGRG